MTEREHIRTAVDRISQHFLCKEGWKNEQTLRSSVLITVRGYVEGKQKGLVSASLIVRRIIEEEKLEETDRYVRLDSIIVWPHFQRKGLGTAMLIETEKIARSFEASKIEGMVSSVAIQGQPWLPEYYADRGYELEEIEDGYKIVKIL